MPSRKAAPRFKDIGDRLEAVRVAIGFNQVDFAAAAGIEANTYSNWKSGTKRPSLPAAQALVKAHGLTLDYIFEGDVSGLPSRLALRLRGAA